MICWKFVKYYKGLFKTMRKSAGIIIGFFVILIVILLIIGLSTDNLLRSTLNTHKQIVGDIAATVPCDRIIYLVYDNSFSLITGKTVTTKVDFEFEQTFQDPNKLYLDDDIFQPSIPEKPVVDPNDGYYDPGK